MIRKYLLISIGTFFLIIGTIGIFIPILPTVPFLLITSICYVKSSKKLHSWLLNNNLFGNYIKNYMSGKGIPISLKLFVIVVLWLSILYSVVFVASTIYLRIILIAIAIAVSAHIILIKKNNKT